MRQLKFRIWDKLQKQYIYSTDWAARHYTISLDGKVNNLQNGAGPEDFAVHEFTGLQDKNGKDIYEGDLIEYNGAISHIEYNVDSACLSLKISDTCYRVDIHLLRDADYKVVPELMKIVGNLMENKDLEDNYRAKMRESINKNITKSAMIRDKSFAKGEK